MRTRSGGTNVKGPGFRLGLDVRRVWKCPACDRVRRTPGDVTAVRCHRSKCNHAWMRLLDGDRPWPTGLQIDLAAKIAEESADEPEAGTLAPRTAASVAEAIDSITPPVPPPPPATAKPTEPVTPEPVVIEDESSPPTSSGLEGETEDGELESKPRATESSATQAGEESPKPKRKRRRGRRRGRRKSGGSGGNE